MPAQDQFASWLRFALRHLYEPSVLQNSPLIKKLGLSTCDNPTSELRRILCKEIRAMAPDADTPTDSELWRIYEILLYRYVQHNSEVQVADQLGISTRHLRREERKAVEVLAKRLQIQQEHEKVLMEAQGGSGMDEGAQRSATIESELAWLKHPEMKGLISPTTILNSVLQLVRPLAGRYGVQIKVIGSEDELPLCTVHPVALKQLLLNLLTVAIRVSESKHVTVSIRVNGVHFELCISTIGWHPDAEHASENAANIAMAYRLAESCGAQIVTNEGTEGFITTIIFPAVEQVPVLVIDDNLDTIRLLQRYATGTLYRIYGAQNLLDGLTLVKEVQPRIIVLDVMMPDMDGWEVLEQLRQHPLTCHIPIIVCTILTQRELALSLGAIGFVSKPISRQDFLGALTSCLPLPASVPN